MGTADKISHRSRSAGGGDGRIRISSPTIEDGVRLWRLGGEAGGLEANSRYAYLLWCRDFAATSVIASRSDPAECAVGFVTGYRRPQVPDTLFVWQVAVDEGAPDTEDLAGRMLDSLIERVADAHHLETTITSDEDTSAALFTGFADRWDTVVERAQLFDGQLLGGDHPPRLRLRIGPFQPGARPDSAAAR